VKAAPDRRRGFTDVVELQGVRHVSYPPGPNGPYGSNDPYGQQQPQQAYGYPQQGPGYGYPQQVPPTAGPGFVQPVAPGGMPGKTSGARTIMIIVGIIQSLFSLTMILIFFIAGKTSDYVTHDVGLGLAVLILFFALSLVHGAFGVLMATQFGKMGNGGRVGSIVWASFLIVFGLFGLAMYGMGVFWIGLAITCLVLLNAPESKAYFNRPRY
jgi:hypothetical protein